MGEIIHLSTERIHITVYVAGDGWWVFRRPRLRSLDSERTLAMVQGLVKELGQWYFEVHTRCWHTRCYEALLRGGWRAPVVMVGRHVYSEGCVPDRARLRTYLLEQMHILRPRLAKSG